MYRQIASKEFLKIGRYHHVQADSSRELSEKNEIVSKISCATHAFFTPFDQTISFQQYKVITS